ncbi:NUDIX hydrolase [Aliirhizobium terrae]|uniref:NUDIX hydrolase n=1 Tax=Terrirhizobium terrae TaxID=2926709 RepID=UPI002576E57A|nr:NUDIX hydrolase [Rhizobium sp. CC-CFT758]WJH39905.1 NUDIX hydrolase [Rhizobium sp. CC-CFT758]
MTDSDSHGLDDFRDWPEEGRVFPASSAEIRVLDGPHPFCLSDSDEIAANWQREVTANPALFDGQMVFHRELRVIEGRIEGEGHVVPYSAFLWWRRKADRQGGVHLFCYPVLVSADGALIAVTMGNHTANPGQVYFAAGSLEPMDVVDGRCDMEANMRREVLEETGLDLLQCRSDAGFHAVRLGRTIALCKLYRFEATAEEIVASIEAHMQVAEDDEIAGAVIIRSADPSAYRYNAAMLPVIDWYFATVRT